jgi:hypothetical protein
MKKKCLSSGCNNYVFGKGYCKIHQYLRDDFKKYTYIREPTGELNLFHEIWKTRTHKSFLSNKEIEYFNVSCFAHILPKGENKFPKFKLNPKNIILLIPYEHHLLDNGTIEQREKYAKENNCNWDKIYKLYEKLSDEYITTYG